MIENSCHITLYTGNRTKLIPLLLIGDESDEMVNRYLERCNMFVAKAKGEIVGVCATISVSELCVEVKNLAVDARFRGQGIGTALLNHVEKVNEGRIIILGTGETPSTLRFYQKRGYKKWHTVTNFFTDHYPHPIIEEGVTLKDMLYLVKRPWHN